MAEVTNDVVDIPNETETVEKAETNGVRETVIVEDANGLVEVEPNGKTSETLEKDEEVKSTNGHHKEDDDNSDDASKDEADEKDDVTAIVESREKHKPLSPAADDAATDEPQTKKIRKDSDQQEKPGLVENGSEENGSNHQGNLEDEKVAA